jgi:GNAT superfamily N-acetyltransferase
MPDRPESHTTLSVRLATRADVPSIAPIVNAAFAVETFLEGVRTDENGIADMMTHGDFLVGEDRTGRIVASVFTELRDEHAYLGMLAVDPARQGEKFGRIMTEAVAERARELGCSQIDIDVLSLRPELIPFYTRLGYVETAREPFRPNRAVKPGFECHSIKMSKIL